MSKCIYCNQEKEENEFSLEHIFPDSLGGSFANNLFKTRQVCKRCNSLSGLYVDSAFVKNFFATALVPFSKYMGYYDFDKFPYIPFAYFGFVEYVKHPEYKFCEKWVWAGGSMVYHFHNNSDDDFTTIAGGDPRKRKGSGAGEVYLVGLTDNQFWIELLVNAFSKQFKKSKKLLVNYTLPEEVKKKQSKLTENQEKSKKELFSLHEKKEMQHHKLHVKIDFNVRFQAKLSLGLGYSLFGEKFTLSCEAEKSRNIFWNKDYKQLEKLEPEMLQFFSEPKEAIAKFTKFLGFPGSHGLFFFIVDNSLIFYADLYGEGQYPILTVITRNVNDYSHELINKYPNGWGYILIPQRELLIGEFDIGSMIAYNTGDKSYIPELIEIEKVYKSAEELPPLNLKDEI